MALGRVRNSFMVVCISLLVVRRVRIDDGYGKCIVERGGEIGVEEWGGWVSGRERVKGRGGGGDACAGFVFCVEVVCLEMRSLCS